MNRLDLPASVERLPIFGRRHLRPAMQDFLEASGMSLGELNGVLFHPGGAKVLETVHRPSERRSCLFMGSVARLRHDVIAHRLVYP
jgi:hypothetical protein